MLFKTFATAVGIGAAISANLLSVIASYKASFTQNYSLIKNQLTFRVQAPLNNRPRRRQRNFSHPQTLT